MGAWIVVAVLTTVLLVGTHFFLLTTRKHKIQNENINQQMHIMKCLTDIYLSAHIIDIKSDSFYEINSRNHIRDIVGKEGHAQVTMTRVMEKLAGDDYKERVLAFVDFSTLNERLGNLKMISLEFYGKRSGWCRAVYIVVNRDEKGNVETVIFAVQKIDEEKTRELEYQKQLKKSAEEAQRANIAKTEFLSRMSHDIRTPINAVIGMLDILDTCENDVQKSRECRSKIRISSNHLLSLINDVLDMSKLESGTTEYVEEPFDLMEVIENCKEIVRPIAEECGVRLLDFNPKDIEYSKLIGCPLYLRQILVNIISNSIKYNKLDGTVELKVLKENVENKTVTYRFVIKDTGIGMSEEFLKKVFEPFSQENYDARTTYKGTGLGLAIVKELVTLMNGTITVDSQKGVGSRFEVSLPFKINENVVQNKDVEVEYENINIEGIKVLLVEDNEFNTEVAQFMLEALGVIVTTVDNGKKAVDTFMENDSDTFDVILMDVRMPVMDGLTATRQIRKLDREDAKKIPIFSMTANAFDEDAKKCIEAGMNEHLSKPLDIKKLKYYINKYCGK